MKILILHSLGFLLPMLLAAADLPLDRFIQLARNPNTTSTYAKLEGVLQHRRRGSDVKTMPLYFGIIIQPERSTARLIIDRDESYTIGQSRDINGSTVIPAPENRGDKLGATGIKAGDLTMNFLYFPVVKELENTTLGGMVPCRVILFEAPDHSEQVRAYLASEYAFPLKAEFIRTGESQPYRTMEVGGFTKKNDLYYARRIRVEGPGWATRVDFDSDTAVLGVFDPDNPPPDVMRRPAGTNVKGDEK